MRIKLCPFCGKTAQTVVDDETETRFGVKCFSCGGCIYPEKETLQDAVEAWNSRDYSTVPSEQQRWRNGE